MVYIGDVSQVKSAATQVAAGLVANWGMLNAGMSMGFPSAVVPPLLGSGPGLHASVDQASWIASLSYISGLVASLLAGPLIDRLGRRWGLQLMNLTCVSGWLIMAVFPHYLLSLYVGRVVTGIGVGLVCASVTYTVEVSTVSLRTALVNFNPALKAIGTFLVYLWVFFYQNSWTEVSYFGFGLTLLPTLLTPLLPESPLWLLNKGRDEEALKALMKLRGASDPEQVQEELDSLSSMTKDKIQTTSCLSTLTNIRRPEAYKPLIFLNTYMIFTQTTGVAIVMNFAVEFVQKTGIDEEAYYIALAISSMRMFSTLLTLWACSKYGMRPSAILSGVLMVMSLGVLTLSLSPLLTLPSWLAGSLILLYVLTSSVGFSSIFLSITGELFPTSVRGMASGMVSSFGYFGSFLSVKLYPGLARSYSSFSIFMFFTITGMMGTIFLFLFLPETRGKTLAEIEEFYKGTNKSEVDTERSKKETTTTHPSDSRL